MFRNVYLEVVISVNQISELVRINFKHQLFWCIVNSKSSIGSKQVDRSAFPREASNKLLPAEYRATLN